MSDQSSAPAPPAAAATSATAPNATQPASAPAPVQAGPPPPGPLLMNGQGWPHGMQAHGMQAHGMQAHGMQAQQMQAQQMQAQQMQPQPAVVMPMMQAQQQHLAQQQPFMPQFAQQGPAFPGYSGGGPSYNGPFAAPSLHGGMWAPQAAAVVPAAPAPVPVGGPAPWANQAGDASNQARGPVKVEYEPACDTCAICHEQKQELRMFEPCMHLPFCVACIRAISSTHNNRPFCPMCNLTQQKSTPVQRMVPKHRK